MTLSIIIAAFNDNIELKATVESIRATAGVAPEIVVVDDASMLPVNFIPNINVIRNHRRCGVGPSRHIGVLAATGKFILITDAHMRFTPGWYEALLPRLEGRANVVVCGTCLGLDSRNMNVAAPNAVYYGATINVLGPDRHGISHRPQIFEAVWNRHPDPEDDAEIAAVMGASYAMHRDWFLKIAPLHHLRSWGEDEIMISVKTWLAGGCVRIHKGVRIGHKFRIERERVPFLIPREDLQRNKVFAIRTLLPEALAEHLITALRRGSGFGLNYQKFVRNEWPEVEVEKAYNRTIFTRDFNWMAERFKLALPQ